MRTLATATGICGKLLALRPRNLDESTICDLVGGKAVRTLAAVGKEFGLAANTIKQSWRAEGMPGTNGAYHLADVLIWRLRYLDDLDGRKISDLSADKLQRAIEEEKLRKERNVNQKMEREELEATDKLIDREAAATTFNTLTAVAVERILKIPAQFEPQLPKETAASLVADMERTIRREFTGLSEGLARKVLE